MADRFLCSFDWPGAVSADLPLYWTGAQNLTIDAAGRNGNAARFQTSSHWLFQTFDGQGTWTVGFAYKMTQAAGAGDLLRFYNDTTQHCKIYLRTDGKLAFYGGAGTELAVSTNALSINTWYYIEVKVTIADSGTYEVRVNGTSTGWIPSASGDTRNGSTTTVTKIQFISPAWAANQYQYIDDVYMCDGVDATATQGAPNNDFKGDIRIDCYAPNGAGTETHWVTDDASGDNYAHVNDGSAATYVKTTAAAVDTYAYADVPAGIVPLGVQLSTRVKKTDPGNCLVNHYAQSDVDVYQGPDIAPGTTDVIYHEIIDKDPHTSAKWTDSGLQAAYFGIERSA